MNDKVKVTAMLIMALNAVGKPADAPPAEAAPAK